MCTGRRIITPRSFLILSLSFHFLFLYFIAIEFVFYIFYISLRSSYSSIFLFFFLPLCYLLPFHTLSPSFLSLSHSLSYLLLSPKPTISLLFLPISFHRPISLQPSNTSSPISTLILSYSTILYSATYTTVFLPILFPFHSLTSLPPFFPLPLFYSLSSLPFYTFWLILPPFPSFPSSPPQPNPPPFIPPLVHVSGLSHRNLSHPAYLSVVAPSPSSLLVIHN